MRDAQTKQNTQCEKGTHKTTQLAVVLARLCWPRQIPLQSLYHTSAGDRLYPLL